MSEISQQVGEIALEALDEVEAGGALDFEDAELQAVAIIVAVGHDGNSETVINYRFKAADGADLDRDMGLEVLRRVQNAIAR